MSSFANIARRSRRWAGLAALVAAALAQEPAPTGVPAATAPATAQSPATTPTQAALRWDAETKSYDAKPGERAAVFTFHVTNVSATDVAITSLDTTCGCTVAHLPPLPRAPYVLKPGQTAPIGVTVDLAGKAGIIVKRLSVQSSAGFMVLNVRVSIPPPSGPVDPATRALDERTKNIVAALEDRQAVFKGECARCHAEPAAGKSGRELYVAICGICHDATPRAAMVPDLNASPAHRDTATWTRWITDGGTLMPAFAQKHGGPLAPEQIDALAVYLDAAFPREPPPTATASASAATASSSATSSGVGK